MDRYSIPKKKQFPWEPNNKWLHRLFNSGVGIFAINWVMQGMRGMDSKELSFRICLETGLIMSLLPLLRGFDSSFCWGLVLAVILAHSINWLINGHIWVCARYLRFYQRNPKVLESYLDKIIYKIEKMNWLQEAVIIGSIGDQLTVSSDRSDIDLRLIFPRGVLNWIRTNLLLIYFRTDALLKVVPLDMYAYNNVASLDRFDQSEGLWVIRDQNYNIRKRYTERFKALER